MNLIRTNQKQLAIIVICVFIWRIILFSVSFWASRHLVFEPRYPYSKELLATSGLPSWVWTFAGFDGVHYLTIAKNGYAANFTQVFFPLYPLILSLIGHKIGLYLISGLLLNFFLTVSAAFFLYLLFKNEFKRLTWVCLIAGMLTFPTSFFYGALYSESLFLVFVFISFYSARKGHFVLASITTALASATRLVAVALIPALLIEWYFAVKAKQKKNGIEMSPWAKIKDWIYTSLRCPVIYIGPIGLMAYMAYLALVHKDALLFWHVQGAFGASREGSGLVFPPQVIFRYLKIFTTVPIISESFRVAIIELGLTAYSFVILFIAVLKKMRLSYLLFSTICFILPIFSGTLSSMPRYVLPMFVIYPVLASIKNPFFKISLFGLQTVLLIFLTVLFTRGRWVG